MEGGDDAATAAPEVWNQTTRLQCKHSVCAHADAQSDKFKRQRRAVVRMDWASALVDRARQPPRQGVVLQHVLRVNDIPEHFFNPLHASAAYYHSLITFFKRVGSIDALVVRGIFFGRSKGDTLQDAFCNFLVLAYNDDRATWHSYLSKRPFTGGCRHNFVSERVLTNVLARRRWTRRVAPHARVVGRGALAFKELFEKVLQPGGPAFKRARQSFEEACGPTP